MEDMPAVRKMAYCVTCRKGIPLENMEEIEKELSGLGQTLKNLRCPVCGTPLVMKEERMEGR